MLLSVWFRSAALNIKHPWNWHLQALMLLKEKTMFPLQYGSPHLVLICVLRGKWLCSDVSMSVYTELLIRFLLLLHNTNKLVCFVCCLLPIQNFSEQQTCVCARTQVSGGRLFPVWGLPIKPWRWSMTATVSWRTDRSHKYASATHTPANTGETQTHTHTACSFKT